MKCSNCWSRRIEASDTNILHKMLAMVFLLKPVKCRHCFHAFHIPVWRNPKPESDARDQEFSDGDMEAEILSFPTAKKVAGHQSDSATATIRRAA